MSSSTTFGQVLADAAPPVEGDEPAGRPDVGALVETELLLGAPLEDPAPELRPVLSPDEPLVGVLALCRAVPLEPVPDPEL